MFRPAKQEIARSFDRRAIHYDRLAKVQSRIVVDVFDAIKKHVFPFASSETRTVDLGCGTGELLACLNGINTNVDLIGVDLSPQMLAQVKQRDLDPDALLSVDLERTYLRDASIDLAMSSSSLQWASLDLACQEIYRLLKRGGHMVVSHITEGSLENWRDAWGLEIQQLHKKGDLLADLRKLNFEIVHVENSTYQDRFVTFQECLDSVRGIGAGLSADGRHRRGARARLIDAKERVEKEILVRGSFAMNYTTELIVARKSK